MAENKNPVEPKKKAAKKRKSQKHRAGGGVSTVLLTLAVLAVLGVALLSSKFGSAFGYLSQLAKGGTALLSKNYERCVELLGPESYREDSTLLNHIYSRAAASYEEETKENLTALLESGDYDAALALAEQASSLLPGSAFAADALLQAQKALLLQETDALIAAENYEGALDYLRENCAAYLTEPEFTERLRSCEDVYLIYLQALVDEAGNNGSYKEALLYLREALELFPDNEELNARTEEITESYAQSAAQAGSACLQQGDLGSALACITEGLELAPENEMLLTALADMHSRFFQFCVDYGDGSISYGYYYYSSGGIPVGSAPEKEGYQFNGWLVGPEDENLGIIYYYTPKQEHAVDGVITLKPSWEEIPAEEPETEADKETGE